MTKETRKVLAYLILCAEITIGAIAIVTLITVTHSWKAFGVGVGMIAMLWGLAWALFELHE